MSVYRIDPLNDPRWADFLHSQPAASIFHTPGWLQALRRTYGYEPFVLTTTPPGRELANGLPFCRIRSWLTGERLVSLPFADHCQPLFSRSADLYEVLEQICGQPARSARYVEIRPLPPQALGDALPPTTIEQHTRLRPGNAYRLHRLDLQPDLDLLFQAFDKSSIQRGIRRAERLPLTYEEGTSPALLKKFYHLQVLTRRRHRLPPQPLQWFRNLLEALGREARIRVVSSDGQPVASILTLFYNRAMVYKYGCSDPRFNNLHGTTLLFWRTIQQAKQEDARVFDLGRSDLDNPGLLRFKAKWGSREFPLAYWRFPPAANHAPVFSRGKQAGRQLLARLPDSLLILLGKTLYKHAG
ncbi:MAG TPA: GNAT family N-acetyltransferase [Terriglobales bacterium]|nr:GNAT family N-acetyltransferase [Terriglobales bacterium]